MKELDGRAAVVTGGASGIGGAMAQAFLAEDMWVVVAGIEPTAVDRAVTELAPLGEVTGVVADVSDIGAGRTLPSSPWTRSPTLEADRAHRRPQCSR
jgi:NAD(P)-dependent dehydrogenase (short-subunit alcohol dehydrogenase family)